MKFYDVPVNQSVPTEANRGLTSYIRRHKNQAKRVRISGVVVVLAALRIKLE
jgi:hypothetical protein